MTPGPHSPSREGGPTRAITGGRQTGTTIHTPQVRHGAALNGIESIGQNAPAAVTAVPWPPPFATGVPATRAGSTELAELPQLRHIRRPEQDLMQSVDPQMVRSASPQRSDLGSVDSHRFSSWDEDAHTGTT
jgi:hypothetical protein